MGKEKRGSEKRSKKMGRKCSRRGRIRLIKNKTEFVGEGGTREMGEYDRTIQLRMERVSMF